MKKTILFLSAILIINGLQNNLQAQNFNLKSPDGKIQIQISCNEYLTYSVSFDNKEVMKNCEAYMLLKDLSSPGVEPKIIKTTQRSVNENIISPIPFKRRNRIR